MTTETLSLGDIPDLSGIGESSSSNDSFADGWYTGVILEQRSFTDKSGSDRVFASTDDPSANGDSRNIRLQVVLKRQDGRVLNTGYLINYRPEDLSQETIQAVTAQQAKVKDGEEWGPLFRSFMVLQRLAKLQKIAGVRQLQRNGNGGLDLTPVFNKTGYFKVGPDDRNPQYKAIKDLRVTAPKTLL